MHGGCCLDFELLALLDQRIDDVGLPARGDLLVDEVEDLVDLSRGAAERLDGLSPGRQVLDGARVQVAEHRQHQRARDRRRRHHQAVRVTPLLPQLRTLHHPELVLLVHHEEREVPELDVLLDERVRSEEDVHLAPCRPLADVGALGGREAPDKQLHPHAALRKIPAERLVVLRGQDLGRGHDGDLEMVRDGGEHCVKRDDGLSGAHVALEEPVHRVRFREVGGDLGDDLLLVRGEREVDQRADPPVDLRGDGDRKGARLLLDGRSAHRHRALQQQELLIDHPPSGGVLRVEGLREVDVFERLADAGEFLRFQDLGRDDLLQDRDILVEGAAHDAADLELPEPLGQRIDRDDSLDFRFARCLVRVEGRDDLELRVRHREFALPLGDFPGEVGRAALGELRLEIRLVEPDHLHGPRGVGDDDAEELPVELEPPDLAGGDFALDGRGHPVMEVGDGEDAGAVLVVAREKVQQVFDGADVQALQKRQPHRPHALDVLR